LLALKALHGSGGRKDSLVRSCVLGVIGQQEGDVEIEIGGEEEREETIGQL
jgi:hypothetical protein